MKKITKAGTCPSCGGSRLKEAWAWFREWLLLPHRCLACVECGQKMRPRKQRRRGLFIGIGS